MSIMLPGELAHFLQMIGFDWPEGDEDKVFAYGQAWSSFAGTLDAAAAPGVQAAHQAGVLDPLMAKVRALAKEVDEENWRSFTILTWTWMTEGLKNLVQEGFFEASYPGANVSFWITDYHAHVDTMIEWAELLNPPERSAPYVAWLRANW